jgi:glycogen operon protein
MLQACLVYSVNEQKRPVAAMPGFGAAYSADHTSVTFRLWAPRATRVELWLYAAAMDADATLIRALDSQGDGSWSTTVSAAQFNAAGIYYGYRAWGPNWPVDSAWAPGSAAGFLADVDLAGNRFNPNKLLLDPYALEVSHDPQTPMHPDPTSYQSGDPFRVIDTGACAPKGIILDLPKLDFGAKPTRALKDDIIYEVHLRGLTKNDPGIAADLRGTYAGAALKAGYLADLGVTAVEFQPIHETQNCLNDSPELAALHNYWGYDSVSYFAPERRYAADQTPGGPTRELVAMVAAFHAAGLKVFVDVAYNHHEEDDVDATSGTVGRIFSLRGLDNQNYYEALSPTQVNRYQNNNGVGPNINCATTPARNLVLDSLKYWTHVIGADGFRFDLAAVLGNANSKGGFVFDRDDPNNILNRAVSELPARPAGGGSGVDLIAEPYTALDSGGQQQGNFPVGWSEWNDRFRDVFRASQNKLGYSDVTPGDMATRFFGSDDLFAARGRGPWNSINYIVAHDGFTLRDLYSNNRPNNNQPFPFGPSTGGRSAEEEMCWDHDGDASQQIQAVRTALAILALSAGTPMIAGGSEFYRTQHANNNPYNLDTVANWLDWNAAAQQAALTRFTRHLLRFRRAHPCLRPQQFFTSRNLTWFDDSGTEATQSYFANPARHFLAYRIDGTAYQDPAVAVYVAYNSWSGAVRVTIPPPRGGSAWFVVADTSANAESWGNIHPASQEVALGGGQYLVNARSVIALIAR